MRLLLLAALLGCGRDPVAPEPVCRLVPLIVTLNGVVVDTVLAKFCY